MIPLRFIEIPACPVADAAAVASYILVEFDCFSGL